MKVKTIETIVIGSYVTLGLAWSGLHCYNIITNRIEDKTAIAQVYDVKGEGTLIDHSYGYVAFDKTGDGKIDEIKNYRSGMVGGRTLASLPYTLRYHEGDFEFRRIKQKYFNKY